MRHGSADVGEDIAEIFDLDVETGLVVTSKDFCVSVGIVSTGGEKHVKLHRLVTAEHARVFIGDDQRFAKIEQAQQLISAVLENPHRWLSVPPWKNLARYRR